jgi:hypothetical protein
MLQAVNRHHLVFNALGDVRFDLLGLAPGYTVVTVTYGTSIFRHQLQPILRQAFNPHVNPMSGMTSHRPLH